ncbi:MAG: BMP family ABC transporter substrate-binding protein [Actinomycetota bacterium]|nr:BMP family ABC transporter substrate-binding protein [Actinomycetota bacterium]
MEDLMHRPLVALLSALALVVAVAACGGDNGGGGQNGAGGNGGKPFKVGFIYIGPPGDAGWTFQHDQARKYVERNVEGVKTTALDSVPEANSGAAMDQLIAQGNRMIFATSFGYGETVIRKAKQHPDVLFEHATGLQRAKNVSTYFVQHWQPSYLLGVIAGHMTKTKTLGYVGSFPIPEVIRDVNAFTLGARSVDPAIRVRVLLINTWFDPPKEKQAAASLMDAGADVLFGIEDSPSVLQAAAARGKYAATWNSDMSRFGPKAFLSAVVLSWGKHYAKRVEQAMNGTWKSEDYWGTLADGSVELAPYGKSVPEDVRAEVNKELEGFKDGSFNPFVGPIRDQAGKVRFEKGRKMRFGDFVGWDWFVEGVQGKLPG